MRKTLLFLLILTVFSFSGCSSASKKMITENEVDPYMADNNNDEVLNRIKDIDNGATPKVPASKTSAPEESAPAANSQAPQSTSVELDNLIAEYSQAVIKTNLGNIKVKFYNEDSPLTVNNFLNLAKDGFYNGTRFHRVISEFMIQGGDPLSKDESMRERWGTGGPDYRFNDEFNSNKLVRGSLAMANSGPNTNGSQFFIVTAEETPWLDGKHTNFGEVVEGMDVVEQIEAVETGAQDRPVNDVIVEKVELLP
jgi:cyclophilin family peptidyl-prolyl cis-trans isomerase